MRFRHICARVVVLRKGTSLRWWILLPRRSDGRCFIHKLDVTEFGRVVETVIAQVLSDKFGCGEVCQNVRFLTISEPHYAQ